MRRDAVTAAMLPLQDRQIVVTRAEESGSGLAELLRERGARVIEIPLIRILPPHDPAPLHAAVARLSRYDWVVFTSASAVRALHAALPRGRAPIRPRRIAAVGPSTARVIMEELGWAVDAMPESFAGSQVAAAMAATAPLAGASIFWPRPADARAGLRGGVD